MEHLAAEISVFKTHLIVMIWDQTTGKRVGDGPSFARRPSAFQAKADAIKWCKSRGISKANIEFVKEDF